MYPCSSFRNTFRSRWNELKPESESKILGAIQLHLYPPYGTLDIVCGEIDGVVLGSWTNVNGHSTTPEVDDDTSHAGYWTAAAVWSDAWDQVTIDRVSMHFV